MLKDEHTVKMLVNCARCGGTHENLTFKKLDKPIVEDDGTEITHFALCPDNGQPILLWASLPLYT